MIALALFLSLLLNAALATVLLWIIDRLDGIDRRIDSIAADDWTPEENKHITDSIPKAKPMRSSPNVLLCLVLLALAPLTAADQPPQLDPAKPADAVQVIEILTRDLTLPRVQAQALVQAIQTLAVVVDRDAKATAAAQPLPAVKPED